MPDDIRIILVFDPFGIYPADGIRVQDVAGEKAAFCAIAQRLRYPSGESGVQPQIYVIDGQCWKHFRTFGAVKGVRIEEFTPRKQLQDRLHAEPPDWLTDERIHFWQLLTRPSPDGLIHDDWRATLAVWFLPGIAESVSLAEWLKTAVFAAELPANIDAAPVVEWFADNFTAIAERSIQTKEVIAELSSRLRTSNSPVAFAGEWLRRKALLPLTRPAVNKPLWLPGLPAESPIDLTLANYLPLVFPLPEPLHSQLSGQMCQAIRRARLESLNGFESVALSLNGFWEGVAEELIVWLQANPRGMTEQAAQHLARLPGFEPTGLSGRLVRDFTPPRKVPPCSGLEEGFEAWVGAYASFVEKAFYRRDLPENDADPARAFSRWLKNNSSVLFDHPESGYRCVAQLIQDALGRGRTAIVVLVDALAIHLLGEAIDSMSQQLRKPPSQIRYFFAPLPTVTEVCKEAIVTGQFPSQCNGNLAQGLARAYRLPAEKLLLAAQWKDAERVQVTAQTRLLVYRDNRLDENLRTASSYCALREDFPSVIGRVAQVVCRWVEDIRILSGQSPLVVLTGDHGFTYGPSPGKETSAHRQLDGSSRCVAISGKPDEAELADESLTYIDKDVFHLRSSYLAARGRYFGSGTLSGWSLSHGGLLPEEVIVPLVEWFGEEIAVRWPDISFPAPAFRDRQVWRVSIVVSNSHPVAIPAGSLRVRANDEGPGVNTTFPRLDPGKQSSLTIDVPGKDLPDTPTVRFEVTISLNNPEGSSEREAVRYVSVAKARQLAEKTDAQVAFEGMF